MNQHLYDLIFMQIYAYIVTYVKNQTENIESILNCSESHIIHHADHTPYIICIIFFKALDMALQISLIFKLSLQLHTLQLLNASHQGNVSFLQASSWRTFYSKLLIPVPSFFFVSTAAFFTGWPHFVRLQHPEGLGTRQSNQTIKFMEKI